MILKGERQLLVIFWHDIDHGVPDPVLKVWHCVWEISNQCCGFCGWKSWLVDVAHFLWREKITKSWNTVEEVLLSGCRTLFFLSDRFPLTRAQAAQDYNNRSSKTGEATSNCKAILYDVRGRHSLGMSCTLPRHTSASLLGCENFVYASYFL